MPLFWFVAGILTTLAVLIALLPWLRAVPGLKSAPAVPWQASIVGVVIAAAVFGLYIWLGRPGAAMQSGAFQDSVKLFDSARSLQSDTTNTVDTTVNTVDPSAAKPGAASMDTAISNLEARLAKDGGSADDWELLAKSFEFLGRPSDAAKARARQLPPFTPGLDSAGAQVVGAQASGAQGSDGAQAASGVAVSGEITLDPALIAKAAAGETLFIVAKSVDAPGAPVAVFRGTVGGWPLKFTLDDSQSMLPGRNLSSAGRVTIEARISRKGQAQPAAGDLQGSSGVINPAEHRPLKILIDRVIT